MGTRGLYGFRYQGKYYLVYNQLDSYYSYLGNILLNEIKLMILEDRFDEWLEKFKILNIKFIDEENIDQKNIYIQEQSFELLLNTNKIIIIEEKYNNYKFGDVEYVYVCNFDRKCFEIYHYDIKEKEYYIKIPDNLEDDIDEY